MINKASQLLCIDFRLSKRSMCDCCLHLSCVGALKKMQSLGETSVSILKKHCFHQKHYECAHTLVLCNAEELQVTGNASVVTEGTINSG